MINDKLIPKFKYMDMSSPSSEDYVHLYVQVVTYVYSAIV